MNLVGSIWTELFTAESKSSYQNGADWVDRHSDKHASRKFLEAPCAFEVLMIHEVLQFALRIAFRCVLHQCGNRDIHCWKLYHLEHKLLHSHSWVVFQIFISMLIKRCNLRKDMHPQQQSYENVNRAILIHCKKEKPCSFLHTLYCQFTKLSGFTM